MDLHFQVSELPGFSSFLVVAQLEQPLETETWGASIEKKTWGQFFLLR
jgi:hypothetical protein